MKLAILLSLLLAFTYSRPERTMACRGEPREQYTRIYHRISDYATDDQYLTICQLAGEQAGTVGQSVDDAMVGDLDYRTLVEYGRQYNKVALESFRDTFYPGVHIEYRDLPPDGEREIVQLTDDLQQHETLEYATRELDDITTLVIHHTVSPPDRTMNCGVGNRAGSISHRIPAKIATDSRTLAGMRQLR